VAIDQAGPMKPHWVLVRASGLDWIDLVI